VLESGVVTVSVTQERWEKARGIIGWIDSEISGGDDVDFKMLEKHRGFLVYVSRTYPAMVPYLKGIHLTLDSWRPWRSSDGWKMTQSEITMALNDESLDFMGEGHVSDRKAPNRVNWVPHLREDVDALLCLTRLELPPHRVVRPREGSTVVSCFGDASGSGFGSCYLKEDKVSYYSGQWSEDSGSNSSNYRELSNLINSMEQAHLDGTLADSEVFVFTDNTAAESAFLRALRHQKPCFN
jgi:hypothetical protein